MKKKWKNVAVCALALLAVLGATSAFAAADAEGGISADKPEIFRREHRQLEDLTLEDLTDEQRAEMEARFKNLPEEMEARQADIQAQMEARQAQWDALTEEQKAELNTLQEQLIDKYFEFGLIDAEQAAKMKEHSTPQLEPLQRPEFSERPELPE